ncbi:hypothetical protein MKW94_009950 [Papaver nudicaule]|uniref:Cycloeucalenol cycloisomerase n=1 Tax=Papaver nudicaule TaxID=74823 RepID=A0AA41SRM1_PAPNU|nr:hypothetical protein [Papaver nudicaule]
MGAGGIAHSLHPHPHPRLPSSSSGLWFSINPSKRWGEMFFLLYTPFWLTLGIGIGIVIPFKLNEDFDELGYMLLSSALAIPSILIPLIFVGKADRGMRLKDRYWVKATLWILIFSYVGNYFLTHYFFTVLGASYTFPAWKMNNVPHSTFLMAHVCFLFYHMTSNITTRRLCHFVADLPNSVRWVIEATWILVLAYFIALLEILAIANFPHYEFADRDAIYKVGISLKAMHFLVSFPMFMRIDENSGDPWNLYKVAIDALGASMLVTIILDLWRILILMPPNYSRIVGTCRLG